ncbi:rust resistance kinase Lr10-like [Durio zibethinus]|uniref:non-specific serine/threonine protein kinase n=1 Tax=Durio zibethinus TaxID=66656 RepID=A0A6P5XHM4_DURZI|nr:rust resistance kinase Lr10-like [Durio zibethinus]
MLNPTVILSSIIFCLHVLITQSQINTSYYSLCSPFKCGDITFPFPFSNQRTFGSSPIDCGFPGYQIICDDQESSQLPKLMLSNSKLYQVKNIFLNESDEGGVNLITLVDTDLIRDFTTGSCQSLRNLTIPDFGIENYYPLGLPPWITNLTFFKCPSQLEPSQDFMDQIAFNYSCNNEGNQLYLWRNVIRSQARPIPRQFNYSLTPRDCNLVMVPVSSADMIIMFTNVSSVANGDIESSQLTKALAAGFPLQWKSSEDCESCKKTNGRCGFDAVKVVCICRDGCTSTKPQKLSKLQKVIIGVASGSCSIVVIIVLLLVCKKRASLIFSAYLEKNQTTSDGTSAKEFIKTYRSNLLNNYSYNDIKKMTNGFKDKLGEGGYGNVYKGKLFDDRIIAVKLFKSADSSGHNFITEVATIGRIHHFNVVNLLGFCWDGSKQALIYEYMSNGSLADLLSKEEVNRSLGLAKLIEIAVGVAKGIEYLHNGCESRILHLDIKPQNVLLDQSLNPKISDFGLAKVYSRNHSNVTMTGARGTIGYIAPEIFMRNLGNPSHKSDVYSYGMLLLEMVGWRQRFKPITSSTSSSTEAYFPGWIYEKLVEEKDIMQQADFVVEESYLIARKIIMVGLWCIQINQRDRPSMIRVVEMLSGRIEDIEMPPKPSFMFSPPHQELFENEITSIGSDSSAIPLTHDESLEI